MAIKFFCDINVARLCKWIRFIGFDAVIRQELSKIQIQNLCIKDRRILLTRNKKLKSLKCSKVIINNEDYLKQLNELFPNFPINFDLIANRCIECNRLLTKIDYDTLQKILCSSPQLVENIPKEFHNDLSYCPRCGKFYWKGSHYQNMLKVIQNLQTHKDDIIQN
ncbi:MAG: Mut7-C RNAse domain-containing protein [Candidatus Cloacimonetes bacterium]|nr:Mut7-C RNAse domain-containing protein [Candidatus Cloacimonadota bacterium]